MRHAETLRQKIAIDITHKKPLVFVTVGYWNVFKFVFLFASLKYDGLIARDYERLSTRTINGSLVQIQMLKDIFWSTHNCE